MARVPATVATARASNLRRVVWDELRDPAVQLVRREIAAWSAAPAARSCAVEAHLHHLSSR